MKLLFLLLVLITSARAQTVVPTFVFALVDIDGYHAAVESIERRAAISEATFYVLTMGNPPRNTTYDSPAYLRGYADGLREGMLAIQMVLYLPGPIPPPPSSKGTEEKREKVP